MEGEREGGRRKGREANENKKENVGEGETRFACSKHTTTHPHTCTLLPSDSSNPHVPNKEKPLSNAPPRPRARRRGTEHHQGRNIRSAAVEGKRVAPFGSDFWGVAAIRSHLEQASGG